MVFIHSGNRSALSMGPGIGTLSLRKIEQDEDELSGVEELIRPCRISGNADVC